MDRADPSKFTVTFSLANPSKEVPEDLVLKAYATLLISPIE